MIMWPSAVPFASAMTAVSTPCSPAAPDMVPDLALSLPDAISRSTALPAAFTCDTATRSQSCNVISVPGVYHLTRQTCVLEWDIVQGKHQSRKSPDACSKVYVGILSSIALSAVSQDWRAAGSLFPPPYALLSPPSASQLPAMTSSVLNYIQDLQCSSQPYCAPMLLQRGRERTVLDTGRHCLHVGDA